VTVKKNLNVDTMQYLPNDVFVCSQERLQKMSCV